MLTAVVAGRRGHRATRVLRHLTLAVVMAAGLVLTASAPASAGGSGTCPKEIPWCTVTGTGGGGSTGGGGGSTGGGGGGGSTGCSYEGIAVACFDPVLGYYNSAKRCYYLREDPQPPAGSPVWKHHDPNKGAFYMVTCFNGPPPWGAGEADPQQQWIADGGAAPDPRQIAMQLIARLRLPAPQIGMAPSTAADATGGLVGLPVWMWMQKGDWGPLTAGRTVAGMRVTIAAKVTDAAWHLGDGTVVHCHGPGTPYRAAAGAKASPTCGYRYTHPSYAEPGGRYPITVTTTWAITWQGGGQGGQLERTRTSRTSVRINEQQVVVK